MDTLSLIDLAQATGESRGTLRHWHSLGLLPGANADELPRESLERVRLIRFALSRGFNPEALADAQAAQGDLLGQYLSLLTPEGPRATYAFDDAAAQIGIDPAVVTRVAEVVGLDQQEFLYEEDVAALRSTQTALAAGFPEEAIVQLARVLTDSLNRVAEAETRLFHFYVHERLREQGLDAEELLKAQQEVNDQLLRLVEPTVLYFHRKGWERALREDLMLHLAEDLAADKEPGKVRLAIAFADLSSFTPLSQAMGDTAAAQVLDRFSKLVRNAASRHAGTVVKQIGDAFMVIFPSAASAVDWALDVDDCASAEARFPALRVGIHVGPVLYRDGDYVGTHVNIAARVADAAGRHDILVTAPVAQEADMDAGSDFVALGSHRLKGLIEEVELLRVRRRGARPRAVDPVCGMELDTRDADARLRWGGDELLFCSMECLRRFTAEPDRYLPERGVTPGARPDSRSPE